MNSNWSYSPETPNLGQIRRFLEPCDLEIWRMTLKNNRAPLLSNIKLCASFHHHMWIQTGVTVRKRISWVLTSVTLTFDLWPWPFAWTSLLSLVITPENFMIIRWWEHSQKGVTDRQTDRRTEPFIELHYDGVIMTTMASQITSLTVVYSTVYSDADQRKHQSSASLAFVWGIHRDRWIPRTKGQLRGKCFHLMTSSWLGRS